MRHGDTRAEVVAVVAQANTISANANTGNVDLSDYVGIVALDLNYTETSGTNPTWDGAVQTSATGGGSWTAAGVAFTQKTANGSETVYVDTRNVEQYLRVAETVGGTSPVAERSITLRGVKQIT